MADPENSIDVAVVSPHPDDAELGAGGLLLLSREQGYRTGVVDLTRGETGTKGNPDARGKEASSAADVLGLAARENLNLGDSRLSDSDENRRSLVRLLRTWRPRLILSVHPEDPHPDHRAGARLTYSAFFLCRLPRYLPEVPAHSPEALWYYFIHKVADPTLVVDVGSVFERKMRALEAYRSQFIDPEVPADYSYVGFSDYLASMEAMARFWGSRVGVERGEAFLAHRPIRTRSPLNLLNP
jgi:bacillithiol biosynthesis deacetylase BshB1